jgi:SAM-dependent methyltransferase
MSTSFEVNENSEVYYTGTYWNDFEVVRRRINAKISGNPTMKWHEHFARSTGRTFRRALVLNCGNGWVERELIEAGLVECAVGIDYAEPLLAEARVAAEREGLPISYHQGNVNEAAFPPGDYDLVVNHAAAHHIAFLDRVFRRICDILPEDGWFVNFDYVGPHRNQYRLDAWEAATSLNEQLPCSLRQRLDYPPIPVMLVVDPTEAVHAELIVDTFHRYFTCAQFTPLGGALAYPLLTHNPNMFEATEEGRTSSIEAILEADERFLAAHPESTLFAYFAGTPNKAVLRDQALLDTWSDEEDVRERRALENGGEYYERGPLARTLIALEEARHLLASDRARVAQLETELGAMRSRALYARARRMADSRWVRRGRSTRVVRALERPLRRWVRPAP